MNKIKECILSKLHKYRRQIKGSVSILLVLVMLPFASLALTLVESARYQHAIEAVDELLDQVGLSTLADYDKFLEAKYDLLALAQENNISAQYTTYLKKNADALNNSFKYSSTNVNGVYPLSDANVLRSQLLEYGEITVAVEALNEGLNIQEMIDAIYEKLGLDKLNDFYDAAGKLADVANDVANLVNDFKDISTKHSAYLTAVKEYTNASNDFITKSETLIDALITAESNLEEDEDINKIYEDSDVKKAIEALKTSKSTYKTEIEEMITAINDLKSAIDGVLSHANSLVSDSVSANNAFDKLDEDDKKDDTVSDITANGNDAAVEVINLINKYVKVEYYGGETYELIAKLQSQKTMVSNAVIDAEMPENYNGTNYYIYRESDKNDIKTVFGTHKYNESTINSNLGTEVNNLVDEFDNKEYATTEQTSGLSELLDLAAEIVNIKAFYDESLNANVNVSNFYSYNFKLTDASDLGIMVSITLMINAGNDLVDAITGKHGIVKGIITIFKAIAEFFGAIVTFLASIIAFVVDIFSGLVNYVAMGSGMYDMFIMSAYSVYNLPCRTTFENGKSLSGYKYMDLFNLHHGKLGERFSGVFSDIQSMIDKKVNGTDTGFRGAQAEYLLVGSNNEMMNQSIVFFNIYIFRIICALYTVFRNADVKAYGATFGPLAWVYYVALFLIEPFIDTIFLVNNKDIHLFKDYSFLTPKGAVILQRELTGLLGLNAYTKDKLDKCTKEGKIGKFVTTDKSSIKATGLFSMSYQDYLMLLMILSISDAELLERMNNLIQMDAKEYYKDDFTFSLDKSYTYMQATTYGKLNAMFDLPSLTNGTPFEIRRTRLFGY